MCDIKDKMVGIDSEEESHDHLEVLLDFFKSEGMSIPDDFIQFYKSSDGYIIKDYEYSFYFKAPDEFLSKEEFDFKVFISVQTMIEDYSRDNDDFFPRGMINFIDAPIGKVVISCREDSFGNLFYCETDLLPEQFEHPQHSDYIMRDFDYPNKPLPAAMFKVADSFTEFLNLLEVKE